MYFAKLTLSLLLTIIFMVAVAKSRHMGKIVLYGALLSFSIAYFIINIKGY
jgi:hypothetical protein